ncbi:MAG: hypothetical protein ACTSQP_23670 [Promethearchaeota archaeon]
MIVTISNLILEILSILYRKRFEEGKLQLEQQKLAIEFFLSLVPSLKGIINIDLNNPDSLSEQIEKIKEFTKKIKNLNQTELKNSNKSIDKK